MSFGTGHSSAMGQVATKTLALNQYYFNDYQTIIIAIFALFLLNWSKITKILISLGVFWDMTLLSYEASCY